MRSLILMFLLGIGGVTAITHSLQYFYTASSGVPGFPEFVTVGMVDGQPFSYYDSVIKKEIPKQDWIAKTEGPEYWERQTQRSIGDEQVFKSNIEVAKQRFNQTGGVHIFQQMYGCEWDDESKDNNGFGGFSQYGYDGEDFISLDLKTETWIAPTQQAVITKHKWDRSGNAQFWKNALTGQCIDWLKKYVDYGKGSLLRTDLPKVSLLQKTASSPVTCHATGFYPDRADLFWTKDGEELHEDVDKGEILPNHDGSFQMSVDLKVSSIAPEDWEKYHCVFQLSGVKDDIRTKLYKAAILPKHVPGPSGFPVGAAVALGVVGLLVLAACIVGAVIWRWKYCGFSRASNSDTSSSSAEDSDLKKKISDEQMAMIKT